MKHAPAHALPRHEASAPRLDPARILTLSGTLALNLLVFGLLMMPLAMPPPVAHVPEPRNPELRPIVRQPEVVDVVPVTLPHPATTQPQRRVAAPINNAVSTPAVISNTGSEPVADNTPVNDDHDAGETTIAPDAGPLPMQLAYRLAPAPAYPRVALQRGLTGTVLLRVLVGIDGLPLDVDIERSSGHRELDEAARAQVLKRWRFQPATRDGTPVQAIGLVPVEFNLRR